MKRKEKERRKKGICQINDELTEEQINKLNEINEDYEVFLELLTIILINWGIIQICSQN